MAEFGLQPPFELLRPGHPAKRSLDLPAGPAPGGPSLADKLKDQSRLAKLVLAYERSLKELSAVRVGIDLRNFDPGNPTEPHQDIVLWEGKTSWQLVKTSWDRATTEIALILNAWPVLYAANIQGTLDVFANQQYEAAADPLKPSADINDGLETIKQTFKITLGNINSVRSRMDDGADALDFTPVHRALFNNQVSGPSGQSWSRAVYLPIMNDEREVKDDVAAAAKFAIDAAILVAMVAGVVGTMGGAA